MHARSATMLLLHSCHGLIVPCPRARVCIMKEEGASGFRATLKSGLLGVLNAAEGGLAVWKAEKEEERVLDLVADAEDLRRAAMETRKRRSLPQSKKVAVQEDLSTLLA